MEQATRPQKLAEFSLDEGRVPVARCAVKAQPSVRADERREKPRQIMLIRSAKLLVGNREFLCVIRDVSEVGLSVRVFHAVPDSNTMVLALGNGDRFALRPVRREELLIAFVFDEPVNVSRIIEEPSRYRRRQTRLEISLPGTVEGCFGSKMVLITNLSQQGARIECEARLPVHGSITMGARGLPDIACKVRWSHKRAAGLSFDEYFRFEEFARLAAAI